MKALLINGSPNKNGTTNRALEEIQKTLQENGVGAEIFWIGKGAVGCMGCGACRKLGRCVIDDKVNVLADRLEEFDALIVGTPVYYASPNGSIVAFMDRLFFSASRKLRFKPGAVVAVARRAGTTASVDVLEKYFSINQMPIITSSYWNVVHGLSMPDAERDFEGLQTMRNLARNISWILKCIDAGKQNNILPPDNEYNAITNFIDRENA